MKQSIAFVALLLALHALARAQAPLPTDIYFIGRDISPKIISGAHVNPAFVGLDNPNCNRLTFLYAHWVAMEFPASNANHYHGLSRLEYYYDTGNNLAVSQHGVDGGYIVPEVTDLAGVSGGLWLQPGSGDYAGKLVTYQYPEATDLTGHYSNQATRGTAYLGDTARFAVNSAQNRLYNGNFGKYTGSLAGSNIAMELVSITPGLHVGVGSDIDLFDGGNVSPGLGDGGSADWAFTPIFWVDASAPAGNYTAVMRLKDLNSATTGYLDSGEYGFTVSVPEPAGLGLLAMAGLLMLRRRGGPTTA